MWGPAMPLARCGVLANSAPATQQHTHTQRGTKGGGGAGDTPQTPRGGGRINRRYFQKPPLRSVLANSAPAAQQYTHTQRFFFR